MRARRRGAKGFAPSKGTFGICESTRSPQPERCSSEGKAATDICVDLRLSAVSLIFSRVALVMERSYVPPAKPGGDYWFDSLEGGNPLPPVLFLNHRLLLR